MSGEPVAKTKGGGCGPAPLTAVVLLAASLLVVAGQRLGWLGGPPAAAPPPAAPGDDPRRNYAGPFQNIDPDVRYVGDQACAGCHPEVSASYALHPMGRSVAPTAGRPGPPTGPGTNNPFTLLGRRFEVGRRDGRLWHRQAVLGAHGEPLAELSTGADWVVGSGQKGHSYLTERDGYLLQTAISWFAQKRRWDLSPGFDPSVLAGRVVPASCLFCHANAVREDPGQPDRVVAPGRGLDAIGCERCHGPGERHVKARAGGAAIGGGPDWSIVNPARLAPPLREAVCEQCHLEGEARVVRAGRGLFDYRPGLALHDFWSVQVRVQGGGEDAKAVNHVEQMYQSKCFQRPVAGRQLGCTTCHDPHARPEPARRDAHYRAACLKCHDPAKGLHGCSLGARERGRTAPADRCAACHMPRYASTDIVHTASTDHRIVRRPDTRPRAAAGADRARFADFYRDRFPGGDPQAGRNRGVGLVKMLSAGMLPQGRCGEALRLLESALAQHPRDADVLQSKAAALLLLRRPAEAVGDARAALAGRPDDWRLLACLAQAEQAAGQTDRALDSWRRAVRLNPQVPENQVSLLGLLLRTGRVDEAHDRCRALLRLDPLNVSARQAWVGFLLAEGKKAEARAAFEVVRRLRPPDLAMREQWFAEQVR
jgi:predicted CXXCH cytochrome family protein